MAIYGEADIILGNGDVFISNCKIGKNQKDGSYCINFRNAGKGYEVGQFIDSKTVKVNYPEVVIAFPTNDILSLDVLMEVLKDLRKKILDDMEKEE